MLIFFSIVVGLLLLTLTIGALNAITTGGATASVWVNALRNVIITLIVALVIFTALPIITAIFQ